MWFGLLTLATALIISISAAYYSILGLTAIFAAAFWPIVILGSSLEVGKIVSTLWLHKYWDRAELQYKVYLCAAVAILMLLTSMGVFGFLSKAHSDQGMVSGDVVAKVAIYDEKIKQARDNIATARSALQQMDAAVDQTMSRSTTEQGADKAAQLRRSQQGERTRLLREIETEQKKIQALNDERAPIAAEVRKVEAEVGPIKYIAALIYGDNPDANLLEKAVRWVIILIVIVFDPLALTLLLAATKSLEWERGVNVFASTAKRKDDEQDDTLTDQQLDQINKKLREAEEHDQELQEFFARAKQVARDIDDNKYAPPAMFATSHLYNKDEPEPEPEIKQDPYANIEIPEIDPDDKLQSLSKNIFMSGRPGVDEREYHAKYQAGEISRLPWHELEHINNLPISDGERKQLIDRFVNSPPPPPPAPKFVEIDPLGLEPDNVPTGITGEVKGFGTSFPNNPNKGDMFLRVDQLPSVLYKYNGANWIVVDKTLSDNYAYDDAYIDHLIDKIDSGEYDPDLLSDAERDRIEQRLINTRQG